MAEFPVSLRLPMDVKMKLEALAARDGRSVSGLIRKLILDHIEAQEALAATPSNLQRRNE